MESIFVRYFFSNFMLEKAAFSLQNAVCFLISESRNDETGLLSFPFYRHIRSSGVEVRKS